MHFVIVTIFPEFFDSPLAVGLLGRAIERGLLSVERVQLRDYAKGRHQSVDDAPFGGGPGMVMMAPPLVAALEECRRKRPAIRRVLLSPRGRRLSHPIVQEYLAAGELLLLCGRYEGLDERLVEGGFVDEELSLGDFVLNGGEVAALAVIEACSRLLPGAMGNEESVVNDSFFQGLLDHPHYTRPRDFRGMVVPEVLLNGNHAEIDRWRRRQALLLTRRHRPELLADVELSPEERRLLEL